MRLSLKILMKNRGRSTFIVIVIVIGLAQYTLSSNQIIESKRDLIKESLNSPLADIEINFQENFPLNKSQELINSIKKEDSRVKYAFSSHTYGIFELISQNTVIENQISRISIDSKNHKIAIIEVFSKDYWDYLSNENLIIDPINHNDDQHFIAIDKRSANFLNLSINDLLTLKFVGTGGKYNITMPLQSIVNMTYSKLVLQSLFLSQDLEDEDLSVIWVNSKTFSFLREKIQIKGEHGIGPLYIVLDDQYLVNNYQFIETDINVLIRKISNILDNEYQINKYYIFSPLRELYVENTKEIDLFLGILPFVTFPAVIGTLIICLILINNDFKQKKDNFRLLILRGLYVKNLRNIWLNIGLIRGILAGFILIIIDFFSSQLIFHNIILPDRIFILFFISIILSVLVHLIIWKNKSIYFNEGLYLNKKIEKSKIDLKQMRGKYKNYGYLLTFLGLIVLLFSLFRLFGFTYNRSTDTFAILISNLVKFLFPFISIIFITGILFLFITFDKKFQWIYKLLIKITFRSQKLVNYYLTSFKKNNYKIFSLIFTVSIFSSYIVLPISLHENFSIYDLSRSQYIVGGDFQIRYSNSDYKSNYELEILSELPEGSLVTTILYSNLPIFKVQLEDYGVYISQLGINFNSYIDIIGRSNLQADINTKSELRKNISDIFLTEEAYNLVKPEKGENLFSSYSFNINRTTVKGFITVKFIDKVSLLPGIRGTILEKNPSAYIVGAKTFLINELDKLKDLGLEFSIEKFILVSLPQVEKTRASFWMNKVLSIVPSSSGFTIGDVNEELGEENVFLKILINQLRNQIVILAIIFSIGLVSIIKLDFASRSKEIGLLLVRGMTERRIFSIALIEIMFSAFIGGILGFIFGYINSLLYFITWFDVYEISMLVFIKTFSFHLLLSFAILLLSFICILIGYFLLRLLIASNYANYLHLFTED